MAEWRDGGMAEWRDGKMAEWRNGGMVFYYVPNLSCYIYGTRQQRWQCQQRQQHQRLLNHVDVLTDYATKNYLIQRSSTDANLVMVIL